VLVSGQPFREGDRVASLLVPPDSGEVVRLRRPRGEAASLSPERIRRLPLGPGLQAAAEAGEPGQGPQADGGDLFLTLADPSTEPTPETDRLVRFLALLLERKRILRPKGRNADGSKDLFEHARTKQLHEVPAIELTPEFFVAVREQLSVLVGVPRGDRGLGASAPDRKGRADALETANPRRGRQRGKRARPGMPPSARRGSKARKPLRDLVDLGQRNPGRAVDAAHLGRVGARRQRDEDRRIRGARRERKGPDLRERL
jgi:hypothetical protein